MPCTNLKERLENIVRIHNCIGKHGLNRNPNEIKRHNGNKATTQNTVQNALLHRKKNNK